MEKGIIVLRLKEDLSKEFRSEWNSILNIVETDIVFEKGWETWAYNSEYHPNGYVLPESNRYMINFPSNSFEVIKVLE